ncbi:phosphoglycerate mutase [Saccharomonospora azurea SZMC 14600]|uniref:histidine phosphatase family protein n=1 Tax=Saccharomonospora azurea TaxID=40988 RepID=UPI00023FF0C7|nr:histidine phosphatase family protein [Saccharomonospora azurea]EHK86489.1 phosphoglycerate mutase [Saccharomonospora azurea SZMC 14600]
MTTALLWMRHGTCDDGLCRPEAHARPSSPLTITGTVETERTARELHNHRWQPALIASSPLRRAQQTAAIVAEALNTRLTEPISVFAEWRAPHCVLGLSPSQYPPDYVTWRNQRAHNPDSALPGGESLRAFADRALEAATIAHELATENGPVLIVSHRLLIGAVAALHHGYRHPGDIFGYASDFRLAPARLWTASPQETT